MTTRRDRRAAKRARKKEQRRFYHSKGYRAADPPAKEPAKPDPHADDHNVVARPPAQARAVPRSLRRTGFYELLQQQGLVRDGAMVDREQEAERATISRLEKALGDSVRDAFARDGLGDLFDGVTTAEVGVKRKAEEWENEDDDDSDDDDDDDDDDGDDDGDGDNEPGPRPDLYGRDAPAPTPAPAPPQAYVPPHLRNTTSASRLERQIRGQLNRLAESNLEAISKTFLELYASHPRASVSLTTSKELMDLLANLEHMTAVWGVVYAGFISVLHASVGNDVGAHFLEQLAVEFARRHAEGSSAALNILMVLMELYNFRVVGPALVVGILDRLVVDFGDLSIEAILLIVRVAGFTLRGDDPAALRDIIARIQRKAIERGLVVSDLSFKKRRLEDAGGDGDGDGDDEYSRAHYMLEAINDLKNNRKARKETAELSRLPQMKKQVQLILKRLGGSMGASLAVSFEDLVEAETRGRWWLVGSAWAGPAAKEARDRDDNDDDEAGGDGVAAAEAGGEDDNPQLLAVAKKLHFNTDVRRSVFFAIATSQDYLDAFEKISKLQLRSKQEREIVHVILQVCKSEPSSNPFYSHLASKFCQLSKAFRYTFQLRFWDCFKATAEETTRANYNLALLLAFLVAQGDLEISTLAPVDFDAQTSAGLLFFRAFFRSLLAQDVQDTRIKRVFRILDKTKFRALRQDIHFFVRAYVIDDAPDVVKDRWRMVEDRM